MGPQDPRWFLKQDLIATQNFPIGLGLQISELQLSSCFCIPSIGIADVNHHAWRFYVDAGVELGSSHLHGEYFNRAASPVPCFGVLQLLGLSGFSFLIFFFKPKREFIGA